MRRLFSIAIVFFLLLPTAGALLLSPDCCAPKQTKAEAAPVEHAACHKAAAKAVPETASKIGALSTQCPMTCCGASNRGSSLAFIPPATQHSAFSQLTKISGAPASHSSRPVFAVTGRGPPLA